MQNVPPKPTHRAKKFWIRHDGILSIRRILENVSDFVRFRNFAIHLYHTVSNIMISTAVANYILHTNCCRRHSSRFFQYCAILLYIVLIQLFAARTNKPLLLFRFGIIRSLIFGEWSELMSLSVNARLLQVSRIAVMIQTWLTHTHTHTQRYLSTGYILLAQTKVEGWVRFNVPSNTLQVISGTGFYRSRHPTNSVNKVLRIRLQSHQVHPSCYNMHVIIYTII